MEFSYLLTSLGLIPYFTSRAFMPLFVTALLARYAPAWEPLARQAGVELLDNLPAWATSGPVLLALGIFAVLELLLNKSPEARELILITDTQLKGLAAATLCFLLATSVEPAPLAVVTAGLSSALSDLSFQHLWAFGIGAATWFLARLRKGIYRFLIDIDEDDDLGLQKFFSWIEDGIGFLGVLFVVVLPTAALVVTGLTLLALWAVRWYLGHQEEKKKLACDACAAPNPPCGLICAACGHERREPRRVGLMGTVKEAPVTDFEAHRWQLLAQKRCRRCGERQRGRRVDLRCASCGAVPFETPQELDAYIARLQAALPRTLGVLFLLGAVPVVGLVPGVIYYQLTLISSLRHYIPRSSRMLGRWFARVVGLVLVCLQPVPFVGAFSLPLMCFLNYLIYRRLLRRQGRAAFVPAAAPAEA